VERTWLHVAVLVGSILGLIGVVTLWPQAEKAPVAVSVDEQISLAKNLLLANQALRGEIERLDREVAELEQPRERGRIEDLAATLNELRILNGAVAVVGPGIEVTVKGPVTAAEVRDLVNELKSAGAEAIAVNGRRLTAWSSFYEGQAGIVVDGYPLGTEVFIQAIGDPIVLREVAKRRGGFAAAMAADGTTLEVTARTGQSDVRLPVSLDRRGFRLGRLP
jgi:uncharacterized protein YlxW (UPF0749 family)